MSDLTIIDAQISAIRYTLALKVYHYISHHSLAKIDAEIVELERKATEYATVGV